MLQIGIYGYGNLGQAAARAVQAQPDMTPAAVFTRRPPSQVSSPFPVFAARELPAWAGRLDVILLCVGSVTDAPLLAPEIAGRFHLVDAYDVHSGMRAHFARVNAAARAGNRTALLCAGWDPGLFSLFRLLGRAFLPRGGECTFWGPGVSQGHSQAVRQLPGVLDARVYTLPDPETLAQARRGEAYPLSPEKAHRRLCFVLAKPDAPRETIARTIAGMEGYFAGTPTQVRFLSPEAFAAHREKLHHGGSVLRSQAGQRMELKLTIASNPAFTGAVLAACARAAAAAARRGQFGALSLLDVPPRDLLPPDADVFPFL